MNSKKLAVLRAAAISIGTLLVIGYLFYDNPPAGLIFFPYVIFSVKQGLKNYKKKRNERLAFQFRDGMQSVVSALQGGYSIENAFREAINEMELLYGKKSQSIELYIGFSKIVHQLNLNMNIEEVFGEFAREYDVEEINNFAEVLMYAKQSGGNLVSIIKNTTDTISGKIEVKREIATIISAKKMEQNIMNLVPLAIILYMRMTSGDMFASLYGNFTGVAIMTVCLIIYWAAKLMADKIIDIKV